MPRLRFRSIFRGSAGVPAALAGVPPASGTATVPKPAWRYSPGTDEKDRRKHVRCLRYRVPIGIRSKAPEAPYLFIGLRLRGGCQSEPYTANNEHVCDDNLWRPSGAWP